MRLTDFSRFRLAVEMLGIPSIAGGISRELRHGDEDVVLEHVVRGDGLYSVIKRGEHFFITRIILHIVNYQVYFLNQPGGENALLAFRKDDYDAPELREKIHKYHFSNCQTIKKMFKNNFGKKYKQSHRQDGKFRYIFIEDDKVIKERKDQKLNVCKFCFRWFCDKIQKQLQAKEFLPSDFFDNIDDSEWLPDCGYHPAETALPAIYTEDFAKIAKKIRGLRNYQCEQCKINLQRQDLHKFLHCHHIDMVVTDNRIANLKCLCIKCHAEQPMHGHIKQLSEYLEFLPIWEQTAFSRHVSLDSRLRGNDREAG